MYDLLRNKHRDAVKSVQTYLNSKAHWVKLIKESRMDDAAESAVFFHADKPPEACGYGWLMLLWDLHHFIEEVSFKYYPIKPPTVCASDEGILRQLGEFQVPGSLSGDSSKCSDNRRCQLLCWSFQHIPDPAVIFLIFALTVDLFQTLGNVTSTSTSRRQDIDQWKRITRRSCSSEPIGFIHGPILRYRNKMRIRHQLRIHWGRI